MIYKSSIHHPPTSNLFYPSSILHLQLFFFHSQYKKYGIFGSKSPQNSVISDKMSASAACTTCSFFQVWLALKNNYRRGGADLKKGALHFKNTRTKDLKVLIVIFFLNSGSKQHVWSNVIWNDIGKK